MSRCPDVPALQCRLLDAIMAARDKLHGWLPRFGLRRGSAQW